MSDAAETIGRKTDRPDRPPLRRPRRDLRLTDGGELTESYTVENGEVKMSKQQLIAMIGNAGLEAVERDTVYNRVEKIAA
jgi:hypothetical protein